MLELIVWSNPGKRRKGGGKGRGVVSHRKRKSPITALLRAGHSMKAAWKIYKHRRASRRRGGRRHRRGRR